MHLKSFIIGLLLFCIGGGMLWWLVSERHVQEKQVQEYQIKYGTETSKYMELYDEWMLQPAEERATLPSGLDLNANKSNEQILQEQQERLIADMDKLAAGEMATYPFADEFYGHDWRKKVQDYKNQKEQNEIIFNISIACASLGGLIVGLIVLFSIARAIIKIVLKIKNGISNSRKNRKQKESPFLENLNEDNNDQNEKSPQSENDESQNDNFNGISEVLVNSGWKYAGSFGNDQPRIRQRKRIPAKNRAADEIINNDAPQESLEVNTTEKVENVQQNSVANTNETSLNKTESETIINNDINLTDTKGNTHHIDTTLKDLTQQVSAIREYAANQQNRLERLQDGYDWNIIKTFCLRIIRCIDNVEKRIEQVTQEDVQAIHLEEVRDELVFALESSGIEQFEPKVNTYYRGQEKIAEAVKEKAHSKDPNKKGKIEKIIKPGYQFYIDDENVKIVRPAQVRIFA